MKTLYIEIDESRRVVNWANVAFSKNNIELELEDNHNFFVSNSPFRLDDNNNLVDDSVYVLEALKRQKKLELSEACEETILSRFLAKVNEVNYLFSNDIEAQMNFEKADKAFDKGRMTEIYWTAYLEDGEAVRVLLDQTTFETVYVEHLNHINNNIAKYRDFLLPILIDSKSIDEINSIVW